VALSDAALTSRAEPVYLTGLDDRSFDELVREALALLPIHAPEWTNHNPSDPGITVLELLAYFTEMLLFRLGRVSRDSKLAFLRLLTADDAHADEWRSLQSGTISEIETAIASAVRELAHVDCAVTADDFEQLALQAMREAKMEAGAVRVLCVPEFDFECAGAAKKSGVDHVSIVVAPRIRLPDGELRMLLQAIRDFLQTRALLTTRLHVVEARYLHVAISVAVIPRSGYLHEDVARGVVAALQQHFGSDVDETPQAQDWPFGRAFYLNEVVEVVDRLEMIDWVENVTLLKLAETAEDLASPQSMVGVQLGAHSTIGEDTRIGSLMEGGFDRLIRNATGDIDCVLLQPWELLRLTVLPHSVGDHGNTAARVV